MGEQAKYEWRTIPARIRRLSVEALRELALSTTLDEDAAMANECYWARRFGHTLHSPLPPVSNFFITGTGYSVKELSAIELADLSSDDLEVLSMNRSNKARMIAAGHKLTPRTSLALLAQDSEKIVYTKAGWNPRTPAESIEEMRRLGRSDGVDVSRLATLWMELPSAEIGVEVINALNREQLDDNQKVALAKRGENTWGVLEELASERNLPPEAASLLVGHHSTEVRSALAENWCVPGDLLEILAADSAVKVRLALVKNESRSEAFLEILLRDPEVCWSVIAGGHLSVATMEMIEKGPDLRPALLARIASDTSGRSAHNFAPQRPLGFEDLLRSWSESPNQDTRMTVASYRLTPLDVLEKLAADQSLASLVESGLGLITANSYFADGYQHERFGWYPRELSNDDLAFLAASPCAILRSACATRDAFHQHMDLLVQDNDPRVREAVACSPWASPTHLSALTGDAVSRVREAADKTILAVLRDFRMLDSDERSGTYQGLSQDTRDWLARQTQFPDEIPGVRSDTEESPDRIVLNQMWKAWCPGEFHANWDLTASDLTLLANSGNAEVRKAVASLRAISRKALKILLRDDEIKVREAAYSNVGFVAQRLVENENAPSDILSGFAHSGSTEIRIAVAKNVGTAPPVLANLVRDKESKVRVIVAGNPHTPPSAIDALCNDSNDDVLLALMENPASPIEFLEEQIERVGTNSTHAAEQSALAKNPSSTPKILLKLGYCEDVSVRELVAIHPATPSVTLEILSFDAVPSVRIAAHRSVHATQGEAGNVG